MYHMSSTFYCICSETAVVLELVIVQVYLVKNIFKDVLFKTIFEHEMVS